VSSAANPCIQTHDEVHTSELVAQCDRQTKLRRDGKSVAWTQTALYRGQLAHEALRIMHIRNAWSAAGCASCVDEAAVIVLAEAKKSNRPLSEAVARDESEIRAVVTKMAVQYAAQIGEPFAATHTIIGVELPIRWTFEHESLDAPAEFASHLDLLYRDDEGHLCCVDFKYRDDAPTSAYLSRNMQLGSYWLAIRYGSIRIDEEMDIWSEFGEWPRLAWLHLPCLMPYTRKTTAKNDDGDEQTFVKGDRRPMRSILRWAFYEPKLEGALRDELALRIRMMRSGMFPMNPDPVRCHICDVNHACPAWSERNGSNDNL
jgi:hypothetical protein